MVPGERLRRHHVRRRRREVGISHGGVVQAELVRPVARKASGVKLVKWWNFIYAFKLPLQNSTCDPAARRAQPRPTYRSITSRSSRYPPPLPPSQLWRRRNQGAPPRPTRPHPPSCAATTTTTSRCSPRRRSWGRLEAGAPDYSTHRIYAPWLVCVEPFTTSIKNTHVFTFGQASSQANEYVLWCANGRPLGGGAAVTTGVSAPSASAASAAASAVTAAAGDGSLASAMASGGRFSRPIMYSFIRLLDV